MISFWSKTFLWGILGGTTHWPLKIYEKIQLSVCLNFTLGGVGYGKVEFVFFFQFKMHSYCNILSLHYVRASGAVVCIAGSPTGDVGSTPRRGILLFAIFLPKFRLHTYSSSHLDIIKFMPRKMVHEFS